MRMQVLELQGVAKTFLTGAEELEILTDVELTLGEGETAVITGESGCGKSTLLNIVGGLESATRGRVTCGEYEVTALGEAALTRYRSRTVGLVFQFHYLLKDFTAEENVMLPLFMSGVDREQALAQARELLASVGLADRASHFPHQLSGGERQRVAVARSLVNDPAVILADEPTGNLDERNSRVVAEMLFNLVRERGKSLVLVTHDKSLSAAGDARYLLAHGRLNQI